MNPDPATNPAPETPGRCKLCGNATKAYFDFCEACVQKERKRVEATPETPTPLTDAWMMSTTDFVNTAIPQMRALERALAEAKRENERLTITVDTLGKHHRGIQDSRNDYARNYYAARVELATLRAEIERLKAERQWQPIETYDKDGIRMLNGRRVLGWCEEWDDVFIVKWSPIRPKPHWTTDDGAVTEHAPTHWMPLPAARTTQEGQG